MPWHDTSFLGFACEPYLRGTKKHGMQGETPVATLLENLYACLEDLALQIDNGMDNNCVVAKLRIMEEDELLLEPADVVDLKPAFSAALLRALFPFSIGSRLSTGVFTS